MTEKVVQEVPSPQLRDSGYQRLSRRVARLCQCRRYTGQMKTWWLLGLVWLLGTIFLILGTKDLFHRQDAYTWVTTHVDRNQIKNTKQFTVPVNGQQIKGSLFKNNGLYWVGSAILIHLSIVFYLIFKLLVTCWDRARTRIQMLNNHAQEVSLPTYNDVVGQETPPPSYRASFKPKPDQYWWTSLLSLPGLSSVLGKPPSYEESQNTETSPSVMIPIDVPTSTRSGSCLHLSNYYNCKVNSCGHLDKALEMSKYDMKSNPCIFYTKPNIHSSVSSFRTVKPKCGHHQFIPLTKCQLTKSSPMLFLNPHNLKVPERKISFITSLEVVNETSPQTETMEIENVGNATSTTESVKIDTIYKNQSKSSKDVSTVTYESFNDTVAYTLPRKKNRRISAYCPIKNSTNMYEQENLINRQIENSSIKVHHSIVPSNASKSVSIPIYEEELDTIKL